MQIDITSLLETDMFRFSHSAAEGGQDAGRNTWQAANRHAEETDPPLLDTPEKLDTFRDWVRESGGWTREEIDAWTPTECNTLFLQWIAGDCRECPSKIDGQFVQRETTESEWRGERDAHGVLDLETARFVDMGTLEWYWEDEENECGPFDTRSDAYRNMIDLARPPRAECLEEIDWEETEVEQAEGRISSNLYRGDDGRVYFSLSK